MDEWTDVLSIILFIRTLPPQAILKFLPHFLTDISSQSVAFKTAVKVLYMYQYTNVPVYQYTNVPVY